jgi:ketosteroid isomerase-like protein
MTNLTNTETVQGFFEAQYAGDFDRAFGLHTHPTFNWVVSTDNNPELRTAIPWAGHKHIGKEGYINLTTQLFSEFDPLEFEQHEYTDTGDKVFVEGHFVFRHRETGKLATTDWVARFDMREGLIAGGQFYENTFSVAQARVA